MTDTVDNRPRARLRVGQYTLEIEQAPPRAGFRAIARIVRILGPALAGLVSAGGIRIGEGDDSKVVPWDEIVKAGAAWGVIDHLLTRAGGIDPDEVLLLLDDLVVGRTWALTDGSDARLFVRDAAMLDSILPSPFAMVGLLRTALQLNMGPILPARGTSDGGRVAATSAQPAGTP